MQAVGVLAAACVLGTFCMTSMIALRAFAIASNVLFIIYGVSENLPPIAALHFILLPVNSWTLGHLYGGRRTALLCGLGAACASCSLIAFSVVPTDNLAMGVAEALSAK